MGGATIQGRPSPPEVCDTSLHYHHFTVATEHYLQCSGRTIEHKDEEFARAILGKSTISLQRFALYRAIFVNCCLQRGSFELRRVEKKVCVQRS